MVELAIEKFASL